MELIEKPFKDCTLKFLDKAFQLEEVDTLFALTDWLDKECELSDLETQYLVYLRQILDFNVHDLLVLFLLWLIFLLKNSIIILNGFSKER